jgi:hypothetical protein
MHADRNFEKSPDVLEKTVKEKQTEETSGKNGPIIENTKILNI